MYLVEGDTDRASAGSFFKNPVVEGATMAEIEAAVPAGTKIPQYPAPDGKVKLAAAWLVEQAGFLERLQRGARWDFYPAYSGVGEPGWGFGCGCTGAE